MPLNCVQAVRCRSQFLSPRATVGATQYQPYFLESSCGSGLTGPCRYRQDEMLSLGIRSREDANTVNLGRSTGHLLKACRDGGLHPSGQRRWTHQDHSSVGSTKAGAVEGTGTTKKKDSTRHKQTVLFFQLATFFINGMKLLCEIEKLKSSSNVCITVIISSDVCHHCDVL